MIKTSEIDFSRIDYNQFEELCFKLIVKAGFKKTRWGQGAGDNGRDIQAIKYVQNGLVGSYEEKWFFECKHYSKGVPPVEFDSKFAWANAEKPQHLVFILSSHITNNGDIYFEKKSGQVDYFVHLIQGNDLKEILINDPELLKEYGLIETNFDLYKLIFEPWVITNKIPGFHQVMATLESIPSSHLSLNQILLLIGLTNIYENEDIPINVIGKRADLIDYCFSPAVNELGGEVVFSDETWNTIEWISENNYNSIEIVSVDWGILTSTTNFVKLKGIPGILIILSHHPNDIQTLKPYFLAQDSSLSLTKFRKIENDQVEAFLGQFKEKRPIDPTKIDPFNGFVSFKPD